MAGDGMEADEIVSGLRSLGVDPGDRVFVHSSLSSFGFVKGGAPTVCRALLDAVGPRGTVAVPTFTWGRYFTQETVRFDIVHDACETGAIPETFRKLPGAVRSDHVCHSVAAYGASADEVMGDGMLSFGRGSSMFSLYEHDFRYLFLGCGFESCTALHVAEELVQVPYRYHRHYLGSVVIRPDGTVVPSRAREFLRYEPFHNDFAKMQGVLAGRGQLRVGMIGESQAMITTTRAIIDTAVGLLETNIAFLLTERSQEYLKGWAGPPGPATSV